MAAPSPVLSWWGGGVEPGLGTWSGRAGEGSRGLLGPLNDPHMYTTVKQRWGHEGL